MAESRWLQVFALSFERWKTRVVDRNFYGDSIVAEVDDDCPFEDGIIRPHIKVVAKPHLSVERSNDDDGGGKGPGLVTSTAAAAGVGGLAATAAAPAVVSTLGFSSTGIAAGSTAASLMSAGGGATSAGSLVAICQSLGAVGVTAATVAPVAATGAAVGTAGYLSYRGISSLVSRGDPPPPNPQTTFGMIRTPTNLVELEKGHGADTSTPADAGFGGMAAKAAAPVAVSAVGLAFSGFSWIAGVDNGQSVGAASVTARQALRATWPIEAFHPWSIGVTRRNIPVA
jgi:Interferon-induced 6-16 family